MKRASIFLPLLFALAACGDTGGESTAEPAAMPEPATYGQDTAVGAPAFDGAYAPAAPPAEASAAAAPGSDATATAAPEQGMVPGMAAVSLNPMLVRTGTAMLQVDSLEEGIARVQALARRVGGLVGNAAITAGTEETRRAQMELRVPSVNYDEVLSSLNAIGKVESVNVTAADVGEEYTDVSARVANAQRTEARLLELLDARDGRLEEVLNLEREVARIRGEIEQYEGRLRYLRSRSSVSLLTITLHEPQTVMGGTPGERPIRDALLTAWYSFVELLAGVISSLGVLVPLGLILFGGWRGFLWFYRREREREAAYRETLRRERARAPHTPGPSPASTVSTAPDATTGTEAEVEVEEPAGRL